MGKKSGYTIIGFLMILACLVLLLGDPYIKHTFTVESFGIVNSYEELVPYGIKYDASGLKWIYLVEYEYLYEGITYTRKSITTIEPVITSAIDILINPDNPARSTIRYK